jgi:transketolase
MTEYPVLDQKDTRSGFGAGLLEAGKQDDRVVALCADLTGSLKMDAFAKAFPERFFQTGIAEANMMGMAAGLTIGGKIPFTGHLRQLQHRPRVRPDPPKHRLRRQEREDLRQPCRAHPRRGRRHAPDPGGHRPDAHAARHDRDRALRPQPDQAGHHRHRRPRRPVYLRFGRPKWPVFIPADMPFEIGKAQVLSEART